MRRTIIRIGAAGAGALLALGLVGAAAPAGASGQPGSKGGQAQAGRHGHEADESQKETPREARRIACLTVDGHTQGRAPSDPDGMDNGGPDKPGCTGGFDDDRDGNNGCGNDADREDDNNGRCGPGAEPVPARDSSSGRSLATDATVGVLAAGSSGATGTDPTLSGATDGSGTEDPPASAAGAAAETPTEVLGQTLARPDDGLPAALPRTGAGVAGLAALGGLLCGGGRVALLARRLLRIG